MASIFAANLVSTSEYSSVSCDSADNFLENKEMSKSAGWLHSIALKTTTDFSVGRRVTALIESNAVPWSKPLSSDIPVELCFVPDLDSLRGRGQCCCILLRAWYSAVIQQWLYASHYTNKIGSWNRIKPTTQWVYVRIVGLQHH